MSDKTKSTRKRTSAKKPVRRGRTPIDKQLSHPLPPLRSDAGTRDYRSEFAAMSYGSCPGAEQERAFIAGKLKLLRTQPSLHPADRETAASKYNSKTATLLSLEENGPVPGGVGYGMFYNSAFKTSFATGTAIGWEIVCPTLPGGNVNTWLYVTATNRSSKGVEAFAAYQGQNQFSFNIFDWARPEAERWRPPTPFSNLSAYLGTESAHGTPCQVLAVINTTYQQAPGNWINEVRLLDVHANQWHLVYQFLYQATLQDQTGDWVGSWGPIVETFQDVYSGTNPMGALRAQILSRDASGTWSQWSPLTNTQSGLRVDNKGFLPLFLDPNFSWAVRS